MVSDSTPQHSARRGWPLLALALDRVADSGSLTGKGIVLLPGWQCAFPTARTVALS
jgi:hypothetical protein